MINRNSGFYQIFFFFFDVEATCFYSLGRIFKGKVCLIDYLAIQYISNLLLLLDVIAE